MIRLQNNIKVVFWDLDDTLWSGTLAEKHNIELYENRFEIIKKLNKRGIVNSICSKNNYEDAQKTLQLFGVWDLFVFPQISFSSKGVIIKKTLEEMGLRPQNALFIDDNISNLNEVMFYNSEINVLSADLCDDLLSYEELQGKNDPELSRYKQYKILEEKTSCKNKASSNEEFLRESNIRIKFLDYCEKSHERLCELTERTNQLNFTKNRMNSDQLKELVASGVEIKLINVEDNFGDYGVVGFYALKDNTLIHFVFSCRIMNMGVEQFVYSHIGCPELNIIGETATIVKKEITKPDYITIIEQGELVIDSVEKVLNPESQIDIFAIGACDLYNPIAHFSMPNQNFIYECNVFNGDERGVNVGTEYIRSHFDMNENEKEYCKSHFFNYTGSLAFNSKIYDKSYDYVIMSFHDDMIYKIYKNKNNSNIRVILSPDDKFGLTSVIDIDNDDKYPIDKLKQISWLKKNFYEGEYISEERFYENLIWIANRFSDKTKIILITGPELDYFRDYMPHCPEAREQIIKINKILYGIANEMPDRFALVDINDVIKSTDDVTNYIFHLKPQTAYNLFRLIAYTIFVKFNLNKKKMLSSVLDNREVVIFGNNIEAENAYINLRLGGHIPTKVVHSSNIGAYVGNNKIEDCKQLIGLRNKYFIVIADTTNYELIRKLVILMGYSPLKDFVQLKETSYKKIWNEKL